MKRNVKMILATSVAAAVVVGLLWGLIVRSSTETELESFQQLCAYYYDECISPQVLRELVRQFPY